MKPLDTNIGHDGRQLKQLQRTGNIALYELRNEQGSLYGYEVIMTRVQKEREVYGSLTVEREVYPSDSQFGRMGFSYGVNQEKEALERFDMLVHAEAEGATAAATQKVLGTELQHGHRTFTQLKRDGMAALYQISGAGYEVAVILKQKAREHLGFSCRECEVLPTPAQWGTYGWSYLAGDLTGAERRYQSLLPKWGESPRSGGLASRAIEKLVSGGMQHAA
jgi:hypothetical protein